MFEFKIRDIFGEPLTYIKLEKEPTEYKDGKQLRRERRQKQRKNK